MISAGSRNKRKSAGQAAVNAHAVRAVVQILFATGKAYAIETLREKLREFFVGEGDSEKRAVAALCTVQLITALLEASPALETLGLQIRLTNGTAQMFTGRIQNELLSTFIADRVPASSGAGELTQAALEVFVLHRLQAAHQSGGNRPDFRRHRQAPLGFRAPAIGSGGGICRA